MKLFRTLTAAGAIAAATIAPALAVDISGAGATFPYPIYAKWADAYKKETGVGLNYQSIGSGGGIKQIEAKTVTFGATDMPLKAEELSKNGLVQFPMVMGGVVPVVNVEGIKPGELVLDGPTLAKIFLGEITRLGRRGDQEAQPEGQAAVDSRSPSCTAPTARAPPSTSPTICPRSAPTGRPRSASDTAVEWPVGIGAKGNEGVANNVGQTKGSIGYVEYAYAKQNKLTFAKHGEQGRQDGRPELEVVPGGRRQRRLEAGTGLRRDPDRPAGRGLVADHRRDLHPDAQEAAGCRRPRPKRSSSSTGPTRTATRWPKSSTYVPMPDNVVTAIQKVWAAEIKDASGKPLFTASH